MDKDLSQLFWAVDDYETTGRGVRLNGLRDDLVKKLLSVRTPVAPAVVDLLDAAQLIGGRDHLGLSDDRAREITETLWDLAVQRIEAQSDETEQPAEPI